MLDSFLLAELGQLQRQLDVFERGEHRDQVERLEDEPDVFVAPARDLTVAQRTEIFTEHCDGAAGGAIHRGDQVQQGRFAGARRSHERDEFAFVDLDGGVVERGDLELVALEYLAQVLGFDDDFTHALPLLATYLVAVFQVGGRVQDDFFPADQSFVDAEALCSIGAGLDRCALRLCPLRLRRPRCP